MGIINIGYEGKLNLSVYDPRDSPPPHPNWKRMKMDQPESKNLGRQGPRQQAKHAKLYSDFLQV